MNIAFCKLGKSIKFKSSYSPIGGDGEAPAVMLALANNNPGSTFYLAGKSDYSRLTDLEKKELFHHDNVINVYDEIEVKTMKTRACYEDPYIQSLHNYFKNIDLDCVVMMMGQVGGVSVPGKTWQIKDTSLIASCIDMTANYTSPITVWLNENRLSENKNVPIIEIINDPRYTLSQPRDIIFSPDISLSQYDYSYENYTIKNYNEQLPKIKNIIDVTYNGMEKAFLINREFPKNSNNNRSRKFTIILNEGKPSRYNLLKDWILSNSQLQEGLEIYGKWDEKHTLNDSRFKGSIQLELVQEIMEDTKYTFIIPIKTGWVTSKYIEMIYAGVIPFFHPSYDKQRHIKIPEILRVTSKKEMDNIIEFFENNDDQRIQFINDLQSSLIDNDDLSGKTISDEIIRNIAKLNNDIT